MSLRRNKPWFGPIPSLGKLVCPVSWEGYAATVVFVLGIGASKQVEDPTWRAVALALVAAGYCAVVLLTWDRDPD